jgi:hypothetical protein
MPRKSRKKNDSAVAIADTLETLKESIPSLKAAAELPRDGTHKNNTEQDLGQHTAAVMARPRVRASRRGLQERRAPRERRNPRQQGRGAS